MITHTDLANFALYKSNATTHAKKIILAINQMNNAPKSCTPPGSPSRTGNDDDSPITVS